MEWYADPVRVKQRVGLSLVVAVCLSAVALGADGKSLAIDADRLYKDGKYRDAAELLVKAYEADPQAVYLFNIARSFDQANEERQALDYYRKYVTQPADKTKPELVNKANLSMDRLRSSIAKTEAAQKQAEADKKRLESDALASRQRADAEAEKARQQRAEFEARERENQQAAAKKVSGRKTAAFVVGGVGVAALAAGTTFGILATNSRVAFTKAPTVTQKQALQADTQSQALVADICFVAAIAAATTAVILYPKSEDPASYLSVSLVPVSGGAFASIGGSF